MLDKFYPRDMDKRTKHINFIHPSLTTVGIGTIIELCVETFNGNVRVLENVSMKNMKG